jgi:hypothetical protein
MRKPGRKTLGSILIGIICALCRLAARVVKKYPTHSVSVLLHLLLLGALASVFSLPRGAVYHRVFLPMPDHFTTGSEPDELSPPDPALDDDSADADDDAQRAMERLNQAAGSSGSSGAAAPNLIVAQGANALFLMPSGADTDLQGTGGAGGGGGGGKGLARIRQHAGKLFGLDVGSSNEGLLVFLDKSGSMEKVAAQVQELVERDFPDAKVFKLRGALFGSAKSLEKLKTVKKADPYILSYL